MRRAPAIPVRRHASAGAAGAAGNGGRRGKVRGPEGLLLRLRQGIDCLGGRGWGWFRRSRTSARSCGDLEVEQFVDPVLAFGGWRGRGSWSPGVPGGRVGPLVGMVPGIPLARWGATSMWRSRSSYTRCTAPAPPIGGGTRRSRSLPSRKYGFITGAGGADGFRSLVVRPLRCSRSPVEARSRTPRHPIFLRSLDG